MPRSPLTSDPDQAHEQMGFHAGWGKALDQLVEHAKAGDFGALA